MKTVFSFGAANNKIAVDPTHGVNYRPKRDPRKKRAGCTDSDARKILAENVGVNVIVADARSYRSRSSPPSQAVMFIWNSGEMLFIKAVSRFTSIASELRSQGGKQHWPRGQEFDWKS